MIKRNINLKKLNTFGIDVFCDYFVEINSISDFLNLIKEPEIIESQIEIYNGFKGELLDIKTIKTNSASLIPLNSYNFDKSELPFFINRQTSAIPFGFGHNKDKSNMTLV